MARNHKYVTINGTERHVYNRVLKKDKVNFHVPFCALESRFIPLDAQLYIYHRPFLRIPIRGRWK